MTESQPAQNTSERSGEDESPDSCRNPVDVLADEYLDQLRSGRNPSVDDYALRYPQHADEIRALFPALGMLEQAGLHDDLERSHDSRRYGAAPEQLGDYQIIREIGRGGMGVVYEAEHATIRRRVALKVLPRDLSHNARSVERFHREIRTAGQLHHTNIVPVFDVGFQDGVHYYAMQFIHGQSLDKVFEELRRLKDCTDAEPVKETEIGEKDDLSHSLAAGLRSATWRAATKKRLDDEDSERKDQGHSSSPDSLKRSSEVAAVMGKVGISSADDFTSGASSTSTDPHDHYFQRIARIGLHVAEALACAHSQGILHRDIKPANLILDTEGCTWVTDFGLAKEREEVLTNTGDLVGTLRYMSPERLANHVCDHRCDLYGLGLTLYELATLHPAFDETDRGRLIKRIAHDDPVAPRKTNPSIPRDFETLILKAIAKEPDRRYQSAGAMAEDLKLFLADRPVQARRVTDAERVWRWCRRNPYQAMFPALLTALLVLSAIGAVVFAVTSRRHANQLAKANLHSRQLLYQSLVSRSAAIQWTRQPGRQTESMKSIASATELLPQLNLDPKQIASEKAILRNQVFSALTLCDVQVDRVASDSPDDHWTVKAVDSNYRFFAASDGNGNLSVRRVSDGSETARLPGPGMQTWIVRMSDDARYLTARYHPPSRENEAIFYVWDIENEKTVIELKGFRSDAGAAFHPHEPWVLVGDGKNSIVIYELSTGDRLRSISVDANPLLVAIHPSGDRFAIPQDNRVAVYGMNGDKLKELPVSVTALAWNHAGDRLAGGDASGRLHVWEAQSWNHRSWPGHGRRIANLRLNHSGDLLLSDSWDRTVRLWRINAQSESVRLDRYTILDAEFDSQDRIWLLDDRQNTSSVALIPSCVSTLGTQGSSPQYWPIDPSTLAVATRQGTEIWNTKGNRLVRVVDSGTTIDLGFSGDGKFLFTGSDDKGVLQWPLSADQIAENQIVIGEPQQQSAERCHRIGVNHSGSTVAMRLVPDRLLIHSPPLIDKEFVHRRANDVGLRPDGKQMVSTTWLGTGIKLWNTETGSLIRDLVPEAKHSSADFSPDGKWLAASTVNAGHFLWRVGRWNEPIRFPYPNERWPGGLAFSADSKVLARAKSPRVVQLIKVETGEEIGVIPTRQPVRIGAMAFNSDLTEFALNVGDDLQVWNLPMIQSSLRKLGLETSGPVLPDQPSNDFDLSQNGSSTKQ